MPTVPPKAAITTVTPIARMTAAVGPWARRLLLPATGVLLAVAVGAGMARTGVEPIVLLDVPPTGEARPDTLPDGTPVFVAADDDGEVTVVSAVNPHRYRGLRSLVGWCASSGWFEDPLDRSRFDGRGDYRSGPAPHGLTRYRTQAAAGGRAVRVLGPLAPRRRRAPASLEATGWHCGRLDPQPAPLVTHPGARLGRLLAAPGRPMRACERVASRTVLACDGPQVATTHRTPRTDGLAWVYTGPLIVTPRSDGRVDVTLVAGGRDALVPVDGRRRMFGVVAGAEPRGGEVRLRLDRVEVFDDHFTVPQPLGLSQPLPSLWRMADRDGNTLIGLTVARRLLPHPAGGLRGALVSLVHRRGVVLELEVVHRPRR